MYAQVHFCNSLPAGVPIIYMYTYIHMYTYVCIFVCMYVNICIHRRTFARACLLARHIEFLAVNSRSLLSHIRSLL